MDTRLATQLFLQEFLQEELTNFFDGCGWEPYFVEGDEPMDMHKKMAEALDKAMDKIKAIQKNARENNDADKTKVAYDCTSYTKGLDRSKGC